MKKADYSKIASFYDKGRSLSEEIISLWMKLISKYAGDSANTRILDLGCGTGRFTVGIAYQLGYHVIGADKSNEMLVKAKEKDINNLIQWDHQNAQSLTYDDDLFDVVFISHLLHHVELPVLVLKEARRVLVTSGMLLVRYGAIEQIDHDVVHTFFLEALEIDKARTPSVLTMESWLSEVGFKKISSEEIKQQTWRTPTALLESIKHKNTSVLTLISEGAFEKGINELTDYIKHNSDDPWLLDDRLAFTVGYL